MLPLVQMHQMVQNPLDPLGHLQTHGKPEYLSNPQQSRLSRPSSSYNNAGAAPRAFPIRTVQQPHTLHRITTTFTRAHGNDNSAEHSLRRKTPSGTIDNGYDGSMAHLASGPPPLKHMILPASSRIFPTPISHRTPGLGSDNHQRPVPTAWPYSAATPTINNNEHVAESSNSAVSTQGGWGPGPSNLRMSRGEADRTAMMQAMAQQNYHGLSGLQPLMVPGYQQPINPNLFSPAGYQQVHGWGDGLASDYQPPVPLANGYTPQNAVVDSAYMPSQSTVHHGLANGSGLGQVHPFRLPLSSHPLDDGFSRYGHNHSMHHTPHHRPEGLSLNSVGGSLREDSNGEISSLARFKEHALQLAHRSYNDLLLYLSHSKRSHHGRSGSGSRPSSKMVVYPKPPKTLVASLSPSKLRPAALAYPGTTASYSQHMAQKEAATRESSVGGRSSDLRSMPDAHDLATNGSNSIMAEVIGNHNPHRNPYTTKPHRGYPEMTSPLTNAKKSLEMLTNLCEQSNWEWVDGMLLAGCLHYGLEHYEKALEWFRRIVSLDERFVIFDLSHIEAISNIAATLYCLNRQEEAEQHWVQAVKIRPSYLEAVEHLVGLLCSNHRSQEAVNTIEFVQRALRLPSTGTPRDQSNGNASDADTASTTTLQESSPEAFTDTETTEHHGRFFDSRAEISQQPGFGSSGYNIAGSENGRMILLIHAKGNMLYALKDITRASEAFEEAVQISAGRQIRGVRSLIRRIQGVLAPRDSQPGSTRSFIERASSLPLLLPPEKAKCTAQLVFAGSSGQLPGLQFVSEGSHKKSAVSTTSNSLLSLAKIFQDAMSNGGPTVGLARQSAGVGDILALYYLSLSLQESPSTANNVGILLASVQQSSSQSLSVSEPPAATTVPGIVPGSGLALALLYYNYGLSLDPKHVHLHTNLGSLLKDIGQLDMAISMYEKAVECDGTFDIALTNLANAVKDRGRISDAILYYKRAVTANPDFTEAVCGLSTALNSVCDWRGRGGVLLSGGTHDRWHVNEDGMLQDVQTHRRGSGLMKRVVDIVGRQLKESSSWGCGILQEQAVLRLATQLRHAGANVTDASLDLTAELRKWSGNPWEGSRVLRLIERSTRAAMRCWYLDKHVKGVRNPGGYPRPRPPAALSIPSAPTVLPFHTFTSPLTAKDIRMISQRNALRISCSTLRSPWVPAMVYEPPSPPNPHLNIGYVSSDFNNHPLAHLMQSVFGFHDQSRAKAFCYATTASDRSVHRQQIEREAPVFRDVSSWTSDKLVDQIVADGIHILVNLNGYTRGARNEMSFMGFAGTLGAEWCDYLLADKTAIPPSTLRPHRNNFSLEDVFRDEADVETDDWVYSENIIYARDTFFCCDHAQSGDGSDERDMTWEDEQKRRWKMRKELFPSLPDDAIILGNFNQLYKIDPTTFRTWLCILAHVPKAVLWLLRFPELGENNLRRTAKEWAGEAIASRIIFTDVAPKQQHISRARVCDLFLDTPECNAHTTAADVLWSSTPLLTLPRYEYKMCSRMAASILKGALPKNADGEQAANELIAADDAEYEDFAIKLASGLSYRPTGGGYGEGVGRLADLRKLLWKSKWTCALFDTRRWVRDLEDAYEVAWQRWVDGEGGDIFL
ncbi:glycosyl transferase family 41-domain-containing protein [Cercophora scortea]|uniref:protein O-GlcNAc transferase n=1 Tax=Cercophora scortea TaxID=314031 RepID=A0AAE0ME23_9PEZI|nr:glycosyl transferase family 41-domain-containing protein [Cercophora scortea]